MIFESDAANAHKAHKAKLARYETILAGHLTRAKRDFIKRRIEEDKQHCAISLEALLGRP